MADMIARGMSKKSQDDLSKLQGINGYSTVLTKDSNGNVTNVQIKDGETVVQTIVITRDTDGNVSKVDDNLNGKNVTTTITRSSDGSVSSTTKEVK